MPTFIDFLPFFLQLTKVGQFWLIIIYFNRNAEIFSSFTTKQEGKTIL